METHADVLIIGGGVIGLSTGYILAKEGIQVTLLDRSELATESSWAGAGIIPPGNPQLAKSAYDQLRALSSRYFPEFSAELHELTQIDNEFRICGGLEFTLQDAEEITRPWQEEAIPYSKLDAKEIKSLEADLVPPTPIGYHIPGMGQVRNPRHLKALIAACQRRGVSLWPQTQVAEWRSCQQRLEGVQLTDGSRILADRILIATGAWTAELLKPLGVTLPIFPVRGQIALLRSVGPTIRHVVLYGKNYIVPRIDGRILVGATEEPDVGFDKRTTLEGISNLLKLANRLVPSLHQAEVEKTWAGLRPGSRDGLPYLGRVPGYENLYLAAGHFRSGIQLSPATALVMRDLICDSAPRIDLSMFALEREPNASFVPAFRS